MKQKKKIRYLWNSVKSLQMSRKNSFSLILAKECLNGNAMFLDILQSSNSELIENRLVKYDAHLRNKGTI